MMIIKDEIFYQLQCATGRVTCITEAIAELDKIKELTNSQKTELAQVRLEMMNVKTWLEGQLSRLKTILG